MDSAQGTSPEELQSVPSSSWPHVSEKNKTPNVSLVGIQKYKAQGLGLDKAGTSWRQNQDEEIWSLAYSKYKIGGSVESIFSTTSLQQPEWSILKSSRSQDVLSQTSASRFFQEPAEGQPGQKGNPDVVDDVVGDEVIFPPLWQQLNKQKKVDFNLSQSEQADSTYIGSTQISLAGTILTTSHSLPEQETTETNEISRQSPTEDITEQDNLNKEQTGSYLFHSYQKIYENDISGREQDFEHATHTQHSYSSTSEETESGSSQGADSNGSQNISVSLLKSILMKREEKINDLSKELRRIQAENLRLKEEKQHILSENLTLKKELETLAFDKKRKQQDFLHTFDPSSPASIQQQIVNLKNQISDLQEANENAVLELAKADEEISQEKKAVAILKAEYNQKLQDSQEEIKLLKQKISSMSATFTQEENYEPGLHKEISYLRSECRRLRIHNHQLNEENHSLKEELWDIRRQHECFGTRARHTASACADIEADRHWMDSLKNELPQKSWHSMNGSFYRNDAFKHDGAFSRCKAALGPMNIKEPWEKNFEERAKTTASPVSLHSNNTDVLMMGYQEETPSVLSEIDIYGGKYDEIQELSDDDFSYITQNRANVHCDSAHHSYSPETFCKTTSSTRPSASVLPRRPFAPKSISDLKVGNLVKFSRPAGKISKGTIQYKGHLPGREEVYLGVELEGSEVGKHDGIFQGTRFFLCKPNKGVFVNFSKVIMAWE
ncbi:uncharacterized protein LOC108708387 [Xenopus laevis]|uniref:CAP-Gly domain-containing protein n=2 Tax=Xenopus laevis TaxID=8355 RepID=A0A974HYV8_XENLA|nr:uncharacterized protein LOC108708387 [Xenopus laevis]OCT95223.1 hypothetical protein XELAEV_18012908mg [Xenopus laevis]